MEDNIHYVSTFLCNLHLFELKYFVKIDKNGPAVNINIFFFENVKHH